MSDNDPVLPSKGLIRQIRHHMEKGRENRLPNRHDQPPPRRATCNAAIVTGTVGEVTLLGIGSVVKAYNPGPTVTGDVPVYWTSGTEVSENNGDDPPRRGQWEVMSVDPVAVKDFPGLTDRDCYCGKCIRGVTVSDCTDCSCVNIARRTSLPDMMTPDLEDWDAPSEIVNLKYQAECVWTSDIIDGPTCIIGEGEEEEEVSDQYQLFVNYSTGVAELKCITEVPQCDVIYVKWEFCPDCAKKCLCVWRFELVEFTNVIIAPEQCKICVTPVRARPEPSVIPCTKCATETGFELPGEVQLRIFDHPVPSTRLCGGGDVGVEIPADYTAVTHNGKHLLTFGPNIVDLWIAADFGAASWTDTMGDELFEKYSDPLVMCDTVWSKQYVAIACDAAPPCPAVEGEIPGQVVHWVWAWIEESSLNSGEFYIKGYILAGESSSAGCAYFMDAYFSSAATYTCEELAALVPDPDSEIEAEEVELVFTSGSRGSTEITEPLPSLWFSFQIPDDQDAADNDGKTGKACGPPEEEPCTKACKLWVQLQTIDDVPTKVWKIKRSKGCGSAHCHCSGMSYFACQPVTTHDTLGPASAHDVGYEASVPCVEGALVSEACDSVPASLTATIGASSFTLTDGFGLGGGTCGAEGYTIDVTYACSGNCPSLSYSINGGTCTGTARLSDVVSMDPLDVSFTIDPTACCGEAIVIQVTE